MATPFAFTSRYYGLATAQLATAGGKIITYLTRRFVPPAAGMAVLVEHTVTSAERLDNIAANYLGDATLFWRIADANEAMKPADLAATPGRRLAITLPQGVPTSAANA